MTPGYLDAVLARGGGRPSRIPQRGCIPSKALLASSEEFEKVGHHLGAHGIEVSGVKVDVAKMQARKDAIVTKMTKGVEFLFRKNKITWLKGHGRLRHAGGRVQLEVLARP